MANSPADITGIAASNIIRPKGTVLHFFFIRFLILSYYI
jgi:hypothetical protein